MQTANLFNSFSEICNTLEFTDFEITPNQDKNISDLIPDVDVAKQFKVIGKIASGSLICFWQYDSKKSILDSPIVWIDSEGFPNGVFANSFSEFLSLLPYSTGFIYNLLSNHLLYTDNPKIFINPYKKFTKAKIKSFIQDNKKEYSDYNKFIHWLTIDIGITIEPNPLEVIQNAFNTYPRLDKLLENKSK